MIDVPIESRRDYEMFVKQRVALLEVSNKQKAVIRKLMMQGFDDGVMYQANGSKGVVEVKDV